MDSDRLDRKVLALRVIGSIRTPFVEAPGTPIQPAYAEGAVGEVVVDAPYAAALDDIEGFERLWLIYWMDRAADFRHRVVPYRDTRERGVLATRAPCRPNPIGLSVVHLLRREGNVLHVHDVDVFDDTPLLDVKPYVPEFDAHPSSRAGWLDAPGAARRVADGRFHEVRYWSADGGVVLSLDDECIQTAAKRAHRELSSALLEGRAAGGAAEEAFETLTRFLSATDFAALRAEHHELAGGAIPCRVRLWRDAEGAVRWEAERST